MKQGRLVRGCANRRGSEKGRGCPLSQGRARLWKMSPEGSRTSGEALSHWFRTGPPGSVVNVGSDLRVRFECVPRCEGFGTVRLKSVAECLVFVL